MYPPVAPILLENRRCLEVLAPGWAPAENSLATGVERTSNFEPAKFAVLKLTFVVSGTAANNDEGAERFSAGAHPHITR